jgi:hypothetical protein
MPGLSLAFRIDFLDEWDGHRQIRERFGARPLTAEETLEVQELERRARQAVYHSIGLRLFSQAWAKTVLTPATARRIVAAVVPGRTCLGSGILSETLTDEENQTCEWFVLADRHSSIGNDFSLWSEYPQCRADRYPATLHAQGQHFVSQRFKETVERHGLTGLDFLWVRDLGRYQAPQWYAAIAQRPLGHGLDHPWFDRTNHLARAATLGADVSPDGSYGVRHFDNRHFGDRWTSGDGEIDDLLRLFPGDTPLGLMMNAIPRYLRSCVPDTDFAYVWGDPTELSREGRTVRPRDLCFNRRARDILLEHQILSSNDALGVLLLERPPAGVVDLDARASSYPAPVLLPAELSRLRTLETLYLAEHHERRRPIRKPDIKRSLGLLRQATRQRPDRFERGSSQRSLDSACASLPIRLPTHWLSILKVANGGELGDPEDLVCRIQSLDRLGLFHEETVALRRQADEDYAEQLVYVGDDPSGDLLALAHDGTTEREDCPVLLISHEDYSVERRWNGIAEFLDALTARTSS